MTIRQGTAHFVVGPSLGIDAVYRDDAPAFGTLLERCKFVATVNGPTFIIGDAVEGYRLPSAAGAVDGLTYTYMAIGVEGEWEAGSGQYSASSGTLLRNSVTGSSIEGDWAVFSVPPLVSMSKAINYEADLIAAEAAARATAVSDEATARSNADDTKQPIATSSTLAVGTLIMAQNVSGGNVNNNATVAGSNLRAGTFTAAGAWVTTAALTGTWTNVSGGTVAANLISLFVRSA